MLITCTLQNVEDSYSFNNPNAYSFEKLANALTEARKKGFLIVESSVKDWSMKQEASLHNRLVKQGLQAITLTKTRYHSQQLRGWLSKYLQLGIGHANGFGDHGIFSFQGEEEKLRDLVERYLIGPSFFCVEDEHFIIWKRKGVTEHKSYGAG